MSARPVVEVSRGDAVRAFHPRMLGVVLHGTVVGPVGPKFARVDFGLRGQARVPRRDVVENLGRAS